MANKILTLDEAHRLAEDPSTTASTLSHIVKAHDEHPHIVQAVAKHPNSDAKTLDMAFKTNMADSALEHPNISPTTVDFAYKQLVHGKPVAELNDEEHAPIILNPKLSSINREYAISRIMDEPETGFDPGYILNKYFDSNLASPDMVYKGMAHQNPTIKNAALQSSMLTDHHISNGIVDKIINYDNAKTLVGNKNTSPDSISLLYSKFHNKAPRGEDLGRHDSLEHAITKNKNSPTDLLKKIYALPDHGNVKEEILKHPNFPLSDVLHEFKKKKNPDEDVMRALVSRSDTPEGVLRDMDKKTGGEISKYGWSNSMLRHPNYPEDLQILRGRDSTHGAYSVLKRPDISEVVMRSLVNHKNANVVSDALKHRSITPAAVLEAYNRKSKDISTMASKHPMLPADLKAQSIATNPESALHAAKTSNDPIVLKHVLDSNPKSELIHKALMANKYTDKDTLDRVVDIRHAYHADEGNKWAKEIVDNPSLSTESAKKVAKDETGAHYLMSGHYPFNDKEIKDILDDHLRQGGHQRSRFMATYALTHPNSSPKLVSEILNGVYGQPDHSSLTDNLREHVAANPDIYDKDTVWSALNAPAELTDKKIIGDIAAGSPHIKPDEISSYVRGAGVVPENHESKSHVMHVAGRMMHNENVSPALQDEIVKANLAHGNVYHGVAGEAVESHKFPIEKVAHYLTDPKYSDMIFHNGTAGQALIDRVNANPDAKRSVLENTPSAAIAYKILQNEYDKDQLSDPKDLEDVLRNPHPEVVSTILDSDKLSQALNGKRSRWGSEGKQQARNAIDSLVGHEDPEVVTHAFKHMSPQGQEKVLRGRSLSEAPELIKGLSAETLSKVKIDPSMPDAVVDEILKHPKVQWDQIYDAVDHSPDTGYKVFNKVRDIYQENPNAANRESFRKVQDRALDKYPDSALASVIAGHTKDTRIMDKIMNDDKFRDLRLRLLDNDNLPGKHIDSFIGIAGPSNLETATKIASHDKSSPAMLAHIAKTYPELAEDLASNPKSTHSKVYPHIINSKNQEALRKLVKQPSLPSDIRDELTKDPDLYLSLSTDMANSDRINEIAHSGKSELVARAIRKSVLDEHQLDSVVNDAFNRFKGDDLHQVLAQATRAPGLSHKTQRTIADKDPHSDNLKNIIGNQSSVPDDLLSRALTSYGDDEMVGAVANYATKRPDRLKTIGKDVVAQLIDHIDLRKDYNTRYGASLTSTILNDLPPDKLKDIDFSGILDKLEKSGPIGTDRGMGSLTNLVETLASTADDKSVGRLVTYPQAHAVLIESNPNLTKELYDNIVGSFSRSLKAFKDIGKLGEFTIDYLRNVAGHKHASSDSLQKIYDFANGMVKEDKSLYSRKLMDQLASSPVLSDDLFKKLFDDGVPGALTQSRIGYNGVKDKIHELAENLSHSPNTSKLEELMKNPHFKAKDLIESAEQHGVYQPRINEHLEKYLELIPDPSEENLDSIGNYSIEQELPNLAFEVSKRFGTTAKMIEQFRVHQLVKDRDLYYNPTVGGQIWRAKDHPFPDVKNVEHGNELNGAVFIPHLQKVQQAAAMVPPGGYLDWGQFKADNPSLAGNPTVRAMFTTAPKQRLTEEHATEYMKNIPRKHFHVSYSIWTGLQRHNNAKQLVVQINNGHTQDELMQTDPNTFKLYKLIQQASLHSGHPVNPQSIAWARVDTSDKDHWFIDEIQSDLNAGISREIAKIQEHEGAEERMSKKFGLNVDSSAKALNKVLESIHGWDQALLENVMRTAQMNGASKVSIHSGKSKTLVNKGEDKEVTRKYDKLYNALPQELGFKTDRYNNLPSAAENQLSATSSPIRTMNLAAVKKSEPALAGLSKSSLVKIIKAVKDLTNNGGTLTSMKEHSPETYQAAMDNIKALAGVLKEAGFQIGQQGPPAEKPATPTPPQAAPEVPKSKSNEPITHGQLVFGPGATRHYEGSDVRQKTPSGDWKHVSLQGDEPSKVGE